MLKLLSKLFGSKKEIIQEVVTCYINRLPQDILVSFAKESNFLIGRIVLEGEPDPIYIQAKNPDELNRLINEAVYISYGIKKEYIDFFHDRGDRYKPSPEAARELEAIFSGKNCSAHSGLNFQHSFDFNKNKKEELVLAGS